MQSKGRLALARCFHFIKMMIIVMMMLMMMDTGQVHPKDVVAHIKSLEGSVPVKNKKVISLCDLP